MANESGQTRSNPKFKNDALDYNQTFAANPQPLTLEEAAWITPPMQLTDTEGYIDVPRMRRYRKNRLRQQLVEMGLDAIILVEPFSIRYAAGVRNCTLFQMHIQAGYIFFPVEGPVVYFDSEPGQNTGRDLESIDEIREDILPLSYMFAGHRELEWARAWADQMDDLIRTHCGSGSRQIAFERAGHYADFALAEKGHILSNAAPVLALARKIKSPEEILAMNLCMAVAEDGMTRMRSKLQNGVMEQELWAEMWSALIEGGGEWLDYRLLASGERTNPWQQEASSRMIRAGDMLVFDCGLVGPFSYGVNVSRAYHCGPGKPSEYQKKLYSIAHREVTENTKLVKAGASFSEIANSRYMPPAGFGDQLYPCLMHGVGMADEWPVILHSPDNPQFYEGELETGMVICVESYIGEVGGVEGVKLEDQVLVTDSGPVTLSRYPFEEDLLTEF